MISLDLDSLNSEIKILLAKEALSLDILDALSKDDNHLIRAVIAKNKNINYNILNRLSYDKKDVVRQSIAANIKTAAKMLSRLARDESEDVRAIVAIHHNINEETLKYLSDDKSFNVLINICHNKKIPPYLLKKIAILTNDKELPLSIKDSILNAISNNKNTSLEIMKEFCCPLIIQI